MKKTKTFLALALVIVSILAIAAPALAAVGYENYLGPSSSSYNLRHGQKNARVQNLQYCLIYAGYLPGTPDGIFGNNTDEAVRDFQDDYSLKRDGIVGADTKEMLWMALDFQKTPECVYVDPTIPSDKLPTSW